MSWSESWQLSEMALLVVGAVFVLVLLWLAVSGVRERKRRRAAAELERTRLVNEAKSKMAAIAEASQRSRQADEAARRIATAMLSPDVLDPDWRKKAEAGVFGHRHSAIDYRQFQGAGQPVADMTNTRAGCGHMTAVRIHEPPPQFCPVCREAYRRQHLANEQAEAERRRRREDDASVIQLPSIEWSASMPSNGSTESACTWAGGGGESGGGGASGSWDSTGSSDSGSSSDGGGTDSGSTGGSDP